MSAAYVSMQKKSVKRIRFPEKNLNFQITVRLREITLNFFRQNLSLAITCIFWVNYGVGGSLKCNFGCVELKKLNFPKSEMNVACVTIGLAIVTSSFIRLRIRQTLGFRLKPRYRANSSRY